VGLNSLKSLNLTNVYPNNNKNNNNNNNNKNNKVKSKPLELRSRVKKSCETKKFGFLLKKKCCLLYPSITKTADFLSSYAKKGPLFCHGYCTKYHLSTLCRKLLRNFLLHYVRIIHRRTFLGTYGLFKTMKDFQDFFRSRRTL
jgi:hypothetical protein